MTTDSLADRILQALTGEAAPTRADADALADALRAVLSKGTPQQVTDLLSRLVQAGVIVVRGDVNVARDDALLVTHSNVQLAPGQDVILEALQTFRRRIAEDQALQSQVRVAEYLVALRDYCASLPYLSLHDIRPAKTLDEVYVPLKVRPQPRKDKVEVKAEDKSEEERARRELEYSGSLSIAKVMRKHDQSHVLILGESGAGKSTLLRQMAERAWDAPDKIGLDAPHLPILIPLRQLAALDGSLEERLHRALTGELVLTRDLPQGFFTQWPNQTGASWLLLLDALDEVPADQRPRLMDWLKRTFKTVGASRIVITSRPSGYSLGELDDKLFGHYDLLPFTPEQRGEFALRWFDRDQTKADRFLQELDRVRAGDLRGTPLLLTIAAKVYLERGTLPERRSALYAQFVDIWLAEAEQRGLRAELGDPVCDVARFALARLAFAMTEQPTQSDASLGQIAAAYLRDAVPLPADRAQVLGEKFVRVMARRSGVFTRRGDKYDFIHPTFREYLAAWAVVHECWQDNKYDLDQVWQRVVSRWADRNWREVALFALGIVSNAGQVVTALVKHIWPGRLDEEELLFAGTALAEQVKVESSLSDGIIDALFARARQETMWYRSITLLGELRGYSRAGEGLLALARDEKVGTDVRVRAAEALGHLRRAEEAASILLALARDEKVVGWVWERAAEALGELGRTEDLLALVRDETVETDVRVHATEVLGHLRRAEEAAQAWLALARDEKVDERVRLRAVEMLGELVRADDLLTLACDEKVDGWMRVYTVEVLGRLRRAGALLALARDEKMDPRVREEAAEELGKVGRAEEVASILLTLARDEKIDIYLRMHAVKVLGELRQADKVVPILLTLARDEKVNAMVREHAAEALGRLGRAEEAASILLVLAHDEKVMGVVCMDAAIALGKLGRAEETAQVWLALARDEKVDGWMRKYAAEVLGKLGRTDDLLALARDEKEMARVRVDAAEALGELGQAEKSAFILLALARDEKVDGLVRERAAEALGKSGRAKEAAQAWLALASDRNVWSPQRQHAAKVLGESADARVLPDLERIAQEDKDEYVYWAAQRAIEQIRQRAQTLQVCVRGWDRR